MELNFAIYQTFEFFSDGMLLNMTGRNILLDKNIKCKSSVLKPRTYLQEGTCSQKEYLESICIYIFKKAAFVW